MLGIGTYKLVIRKGHTLYLHDVLYAPEVRRNLIYVVVLLQLSFKILFEKYCVNVLLDNVCCRSSFMLDGFIVLYSIPINKIHPLLLLVVPIMIH